MKTRKTQSKEISRKKAVKLKNKMQNIDYCKCGADFNFEFSRV